MDTLEQEAKRAKKRFFRILLILLIAMFFWGIATIILYLYTDCSFYLVKGPVIDYRFEADKEGFKTVSGRKREPFIFKGTELTSVFPDESYESWKDALNEIKNLGANCVRVHEVKSPDFYRALYDVNQRGNILLLIQGVELPEETFSEMADMVSGEMVRCFDSVSRLAVDAVHGNRRRLGYSTDISDYVAAYIIGEKWDSDLVINTNYLYDDKLDTYRGKYAGSWETANATTKLIAQVMDRLYRYETEKYSVQRPVGIGNTQRTDSLPHTSDWAVGVNENLVAIQTGAINAGKYAEAGIFAAYRVETGIMQNLSFDPEYVSSEDETGDPLTRYMTKLVQSHYYIPVMLGGSCVSAARGSSGIDEILGFDRGGIGETAQAEALAFIYDAAVRSGMCGGCIGNWTDNLLATAPNSIYFYEHNGKWIDVQDSESALGIMAIEPDSPFCPDGDVSEWEEIQPLLSEGGTVVKVAMDAAYFHMYIHIPDYNSVTDVIYVPFDIAPFLGTKICENQQLELSRPIEFLLTINGSRRAKLTVQDYWSFVPSMYGTMEKEQFWFTGVPDRNTPVFTNVSQFVRKGLFPANAPDLEEVFMDAGILKYGNANPGAESYDSTACYCISGDCIELRIPWALLNFADPSRGMICNDFYADGIGTEQIDSFFAGMLIYRNGEVKDFGFGEIFMTDYNGTMRTRLRRAAEVFKK